MNKPPAFQFYADDFLAGTFSMSNEERGLYITLLCRQWTQGHVTPDEVARLGSTTVQPSINHVLTKFVADEAGNLKNLRLEQERAKQAAFREQQSQKGKASAKARFNRGSTVVQPSGAPEVNSPSPSPSPIAERESADRPSIDEVGSYADAIGLGRWKALDWFHEMEACGWLDHQSRPVVKWKPLITRVKTKWEADGRPSAPPTSRGYAGTAGQPESVFAIRTKLEEVRKAKQRAKDKACPDPLGGLTFRNEAEKQEFKRLATLEKELAAKLTT